MLLDAAMGTRLIAAGLDVATDDPCLWSLTRPEVVLDIHGRDVAAGAEAVFTNTFGANRAWLTRFGRQGSVREVNRRAVELARAAVSPDQFVIGSIGPTAAVDELTIMEQVDALLEAGVDALALETFRLNQALDALGYQSVNRLLGLREPILVGLFDWPKPYSVTINRLIDAGATIVGANCFDDLTFAHRLIDAFEANPDLLFWLKPSTGPPDAPTLSPADFASLAARLARTKTGLLGGCCGTSDVHLRAIRDQWQH